MVTTGGEAERGIKLANILYALHGNSVRSAHMLEVSLLGVGTVFRLERDAWSMAK